MKLKSNGIELTKKDVVNKVIPIENKEHFEYVTEVLKGLGHKTSVNGCGYVYEIGENYTEYLLVDIDFDILRYHGKYPDHFTLLEIPLPLPQQTLQRSLNFLVEISQKFVSG